MTQASFRLTDRLATMATAKTDCAAVTKSSTRCCVSSGNPWRTPAKMEKTMGSDADEQSPLVDFGRDEGSQARPGGEPPGEQGGHQQLGRLGGGGGDPLDEEELADPDRLTQLDDRLGERLGAEQDHTGGDRRTWRS